MKISKLSSMIRGWFVGDFSPTLYKTQTCEVGVKHYKAGDYEKAHYHKIATEITVIMSGQVEMNGECYSAGDIITLEPGDISDFRALTEVTTTVVKIPGAPDDKYSV